MSAHFGPGTGIIWLDDVSCNSTATSIAMCGHQPWGTSDCTHNEDVSISCPPGKTLVDFVIGPFEELLILVRAFAHGAMGRRIDPSWGGPIELFLVPASAPRLV